MEVKQEIMKSSDTYPDLRHPVLAQGQLPEPPGAKIEGMFDRMLVALERQDALLEATEYYTGNSNKTKIDLVSPDDFTVYDQIIWLLEILMVHNKRIETIKEVLNRNLGNLKIEAENPLTNQ